MSTIHQVLSVCGSPCLPTPPFRKLPHKTCSMPRETCSVTASSLYLWLFSCCNYHPRADGRKDIFRPEVREGSVHAGDPGQGPGAWSGFFTPSCTRKQKGGGWCQSGFLPFLFNSFWKVQRMPCCHPHFRVCLPCSTKSLLKCLETYAHGCLLGKSNSSEVVNED